MPLSRCNDHHSGVVARDGKNVFSGNGQEASAATRTALIALMIRFVAEINSQRAQIRSTFSQSNSKLISQAGMYYITNRAARLIIFFYIFQCYVINVFLIT